MNYSVLISCADCADLVFRNELQLASVLQEDVAARLVRIDADSSGGGDAASRWVLSELVTTALPARLRSVGRQ